MNWGLFHVKSSRAWHPYLSDFVHFFTICRLCWNDQSLKISALNSLWFESWDLKIWPKWVFQGKMHHFEFTFYAITIVLVILSSWNSVWVSFLGWKIQKPPLEHLKINLLKVFKISGSLFLWPDQCRKIHVARYIIEKKNFFFFYRCQPIIEPKKASGSLLGSSTWCYKFW